MTIPKGLRRERTKLRAEAYRTAQAQTMLDLFEITHGRPARTTEELAGWLDSPQGKEATANFRGPDGKIIPKE
jgi:hypothetical protein